MTQPTAYDTAMQLLLTEIEAAKSRLIQLAEAAEQALTEGLPKDKAEEIEAYEMDAVASLSEFQLRVHKLRDGLDGADIFGDYALRLAAKA